MPLARCLAAGAALALGALSAGCAPSHHDTAVSPDTPGARPADTTLPGPGQAASGATIEASFRCGSLMAHASFAQDAPRMTLRVGDADFPLEQAVSASGARYVGQSAQGPIEFWNRGNQAQLTVGSYAYPTCVEVPAGAPPR